MPVAEAQARISSREFAEWMAYDRYHPIGPERLDLLAAMLAVTMVNLWRAPKCPAVRLDTFLPRWGPKKPVDGRTLENKFKAFALAHNAQLDAKAKQIAIRDRTDGNSNGR